MNKTIEFLTNEIELKKDDTVVIGCSGGPDSMALMDIMIKLSKQYNLHLICAHVNHNVRRESAGEQVFIKEYCEKNNIVFETMTIEKYGDDNFHNEARKIRYKFFEEMATKYNAQFLLTAHHADDLMETMLMRIVRGSTLKGYSGFEKMLQKDKYTLARPLIFVTKEEIEEYNRKNNIEYVTDKSNLKNKYTRNRYRKKILPFLKMEDPNVHEKFIKFSNTLLEYNEYINKELNRVISKVYKDRSIDVDEFKTLEILIQKKVLFYMLEDIYQDDLYQISDIHVDAVRNLINSKKVNAFLNLPGGIKIVKEYNIVRVITEIEIIGTYEIEIDKLVILPNNRQIECVDNEEKNSNNVCRLLSSEIKLPLYARTRRLGDKIALKSTNGKKKVKDIFIENKVPINSRDIWPIVTDSEGTILWVPGLKKSKLAKQKTEKHDIILKYD